MFILQEYAVCLLAAVVMSGFVVASCGIGYLLNKCGTALVSSIRARQVRVTYSLPRLHPSTLIPVTELTPSATEY
jgi:hypothetical protein